MPPALRTHAPWLAALALALAFLAWDADRRSTHIFELTRQPDAAVATPPVDGASPTGYAQGTRALVLPGRAMDGYHWIMQAQDAVARGDWRVRRSLHDGGADGREVHWATPFRLYLITLAWLGRVVSDEPWGIALERAAVFSGPVLLGLALLGLTPWIARRFSPVAAAFFPLVVVACYPCTIDFVAGYADHHGAINLCALVCVLGLLLRRPVLSGVAGGVGLWISAATLVPVLIGLGLGALLTLWRERRTASSVAPELFRRWGIAGGATSLVAHALEYFPTADLRLEVNHPLHALAWIGAGEVLCQLARWSQGERAPSKIALLAGGAAVVALPATILLLPRTFVVADPFLWRLHRDFIAEFETLADFLRIDGYRWSSFAFVLPLLIVLPAAWCAFRRDLDRDVRVRLTWALAPAVVTAAMACNQVRWWGLACVLLVPVVGALLAAVPAPRSPRWAVALALLFAPAAAATVRATLQASETTVEDRQSLLERDLAHWLRQRAGDEPVAVAASPTVSTALAYFGGVRALGTLYWENNAGLHDAAHFYSARDDAEARRIAEKNRLTHLVIVTWDGFEGIYTRLIRDLPASAPIPADAFVTRLLTAPVPPEWLRLVPFPLPAEPAFAGAQVRVYEITPPVSASVAAAHAADAALESNDARAAARLLPILAGQADDLAANVARARILFQQNDAAGFAAAIESVVRLRTTRSAALPPEDRVHLVTALAMAERFELAAEELATVLRTLDAATLRRLSRGTLVELLDTSDAANQPWPDASLRRFAEELAPPGRKRG